MVVVVVVVVVGDGDDNDDVSGNTLNLFSILLIPCMNGSRRLSLSS